MLLMPVIFWFGMIPDPVSIPSHATPGADTTVQGEVSMPDASTPRSDDNWLTWMADFEGAPISFVTNLGFADEARRENRDLIIAKVTLQSAGVQQGLGSHEERGRVSEAVRALEKELGKATIELVALTMHRGVRTFALAVLSSEMDPTTLRARLATDLPGYTFELNRYKWAYYDDWFYPRPSDFRWAGDASVVDRLRAEGDLHHVPRRVDHWLFFRTRESAEAARVEAAESGYVIESVSEAADATAEDMPWTLQVHHETSVETNTIFRHTTLLTELADRHRGTYDGWETFVVREEP